MKKEIISQMEQLCIDIDEFINKKAYKLAIYNIGQLMGTIETAYHLNQITFDEYNYWYDIESQYIDSVKWGI